MDGCPSTASQVLELNASDDRGIDVVRNRRARPGTHRASLHSLFTAAPWWSHHHPHACARAAAVPRGGRERCRRRAPVSAPAEPPPGPLCRIKGFAQKKVTLPPGRHKIVVLDEADSMTEGAQQVRAHGKGRGDSMAAGEGQQVRSLGGGWAGQARWGGGVGGGGRVVGLGNLTGQM